MNKIILLVFVLVGSWTSRVSATTIYLKDGRVVEGEVVQKTPYYTVINIDGIPSEYNNDQIKNIVEAGEDQETEPVVVDYSRFEYISREKVDLIVQLVRVSGIQNNLKNTVEKVIKNAPEGRKQEMENLFDINGIIENLVPVYDNYYTEEELKELVRFYESPIGQKFIEVSPEIMLESAQASVEYFQEKITPFVGEE